MNTVGPNIIKCVPRSCQHSSIKACAHKWWFHVIILYAYAFQRDKNGVECHIAVNWKPSEHYEETTIKILYFFFLDINI